MKTTTIPSEGALVYVYQKKHSNDKITDMYPLDQMIEAMDPIGIVIEVNGNKFDYNMFSKRMELPTIWRNAQNTSKIQYIFSNLKEWAN